MEEGERLHRFSRFVWGMYYLKTKFPGMSVTSWGRSVAHNAALPGSVPNSQHLEWTAADLIWDDLTVPGLEAFRAAAALVHMTVERNAHRAPGERDHDHLELGG